MAGFIGGVQRSQTVLFPDRLEDWIGEEDYPVTSPNPRHSRLTEW